MKPYALLAALAIFLFTTQAAEPVPPPVPGFPIGRCVKVLNIQTPEEAKQVGYEYLELALQDLLPLTDEEFAKTVARLKGIGLPALSGYGFLPADLKLVGPAVDQARIDKELKNAFTKAKQLGLTYVVHGNLLGDSRKIPAGFPREKARAQFIEFARHAAIEAKKYNLTILIMPLSLSGADLINTIGEAYELVQTAKQPNLQIMLDYTTFVQSKEDLRILTKAAKAIRQVEIQNPNGRIYPVSADESDYAGCFRALKQGGYRGGFSVHGKPGDVFVNAPRAITLLRKLAAAP